MARRRFRKAGFNTKLIMDVGLAGLTIRVLPMVVNKFFPLDTTLYSVVGAGGTYLVGSLMKKPDLANAGIALGLVEMVAPLVENLIGGIGVSSPMVNAGASPVPVGKRVVEYKKTPSVSLDDYLNLNDYVSDPTAKQTKSIYKDSY